MSKFTLAVILGISLLTLSGCETIKGTVSAPFIGIEKDATNAKNATLKALGEDPQTGEKGVLKAMDDWMKKNMW